MNLKKSIIKKISFLLIVSIIFLNLSFLTAPKKAVAFGVGSTEPTQIVNTWSRIADFIWEKYQVYLKQHLASIAKIAARKLVSNITRATVDWINNGFQGNPAYVADIEKFLAGPGGVGDQVVGQFFADTKNLAFLCDPFKIQVKLALQLSYGYGLEGIGCTLTQISRNINAAANKATAIIDLNGRSITIDKDGKINGRTVSNFTRGGGWYAWLKNTLQPQNSPVGAYLIAKADMDQKIITAQGTKERELNFGSGALTYKICKDVYKASNGELRESKEYVEGARPPIPPNIVSTEPKCVVKTPGSAITAMLGFKATADGQQANMASVFSDGLDQIFGALVGAVMQLALNQLKNGVLDGNVAANNNYNLALGTAWGNSIGNYNANITNINNDQNAWNNFDWNFPENTVYPSSTPISAGNFGTLAFGTTTMNWFSTSTTNNLDDLFNITPNNVVVLPEPVLNDPNIFVGLTALDRAKNNANSLINSYTKSELAYQNTQLIAQNVLTSGRVEFASSSACNISYNRIDTTLRSNLIRANVLTNIDGKTDSDRIIATIPWNFKTIEAALENSKAHIVLLEKAANGVRAASNITAITDAMIPINSTSFNTDPQAKLVDNIKTWLRGVRNMYNSPLCPIDLTKTLQINTVPGASGQVVGGAVINY